MEDQKYPSANLDKQKKEKHMDKEKDKTINVSIRERYKKTPSFIQQIQRIQQQREQLNRKIGFKKQKDRATISKYLRKKLLIPSTLRINSSCQQIINIYPYIVQATSYSSCSQERKKGNQGRNFCIDNQILKSKALLNKKEAKIEKNRQNQDEKWRLEMSAQQVNGFLYGKDMRVRKRWLIDKKIHQLKSLHFRKRSKSIFIASTSNKEKERKLVEEKRLNAKRQNTREKLHLPNRVLFRKVRREKLDSGHIGNSMKLMEPRSQAISLKKLRSTCHINQFAKIKDMANEHFQFSNLQQHNGCQPIEREII